jgi:hypothetical protein
MKIEPFYNKTIEHRLALGLLAQPQSDNRKRNQSNPWLDAFCLIAAATMAGLVAWVILP